MVYRGERAGIEEDGGGERETGSLLFKHYIDQAIARATHTRNCHTSASIYLVSSFISTYTLLLHTTSIRSHSPMLITSTTPLDVLMDGSVFIVALDGSEVVLSRKADATIRVHFGVRRHHNGL